MSWADELEEQHAVSDATHFCRLLRARRERNVGALLALAVESGAAQMLALILSRGGEAAAQDLRAFYLPWPTRWSSDAQSVDMMGTE